MERDHPIGVITDALGEEERIVKSPGRGMVLGLLKNPTVHHGDALFHLALPEGAPAPRKAVAGAVLPMDPRSR